MKKYIFLLILILSAGFVFSGGKIEKNTENALEPAELTIVTPTGFTAISLAEFISGNRQFTDDVKLKYEVLESPDLLGAKVLSGEADLFLAPSIFGAKLYNKGIDIKYAGTVIWGILYIVTTENISDWEDLRGREIAMLGRGLSPDIITRYLLEINGLDPEKDVKLKYVQNTAELAPAFITGKSPISMMPEPAFSLVKTKRPDAEILIDLQKEWAKISGTSNSYPQASLFIKAETAEKYPDFIKAFIREYSESIDRINSDPEAAGKKASSFLSTPPAEIIEKSIPGGNLKWLNSEEAAEPMKEYLQILLESNPDSIGGAQPDDRFYYKSR